MSSQKIEKIKPPANGKKLWRVRRSVSSTSSNNNDHDSSNECLQNSLKIVAVGTQYTTKRPPLKRPKNKPGMPKDFVFVDLSPIKTESDTSSDEIHSPFSTTDCQMSTPNDSFDEILFNENQSQLSFSSMESQDDIFSDVDYSKMSNLWGFDDIYDTRSQQSTTNDSTFGLGISGIDWNTPALQTQTSLNLSPGTYNTGEFSQSLDQLYPINYELSTQSVQNNTDATNLLQKDTQEMITSNISHKRSKSCSEVTKKKPSQGIQFKTYKGPNFSKKRRVSKHKHSNSESSILSTPKNTFNTPSVGSLDDFLKLGQQFQSDLKLDKNGEPLIYSPESEYSEFDYDSLGKALKADTSDCDTSHFMTNKIENFDFSLFVL